MPICERNDRIVYARTGDGEFKMVPDLSTATAKEVENFYSNLEKTEPSHAEFLKFNLKGLVALATSPNTRARAWLADYLRHSPDTPESRQLRDLLAPGR